MKNLRKKLFLSILAVAFAVVSLATSTFAWFSVNTRVTVSGMTATTKVSSNILVAPDTLASTARAAEANFGTSAAISVSGILEPVSTVDGKHFFYTTKAKANGAREDAGTYVAYNAAEVPTSGSAEMEEEKFNAAYGTTGAKAYIDYVFQLKAINPEENDAVIDLTMLSLEYNGDKNSSKAHRVAIFVENISENEDDVPAGGSGTLVGMWAPSGAANQTTGKAVGAEGTAVADRTYAGAASGSITSVSAQTTEYFKVVVRLWLEGEDTTCTNGTFLPLTGTWSLKVAFSLDTNESITSETAISLYRSAAVEENAVNVNYYTDDAQTPKVYKYTEDRGYVEFTSENFGEDYSAAKLNAAKDALGIA